MSKTLIQNFRKIQFQEIHKSTFKHNLKNDFHLIAIPYQKQNILAKEIHKWKVIKSFTLNYRKFEYSKIVFDNIFPEKIFFYLVKDTQPKYKLFNKYYSKKYINIESTRIKNKLGKSLRNFFITRNPTEFIEKYSLIFGIKALKYLENDLKGIDRLKPLNKPLGYLGWKNFNEFIFFANISCDWIVLRNFEFLPLNFSKNDKDIDILCRDKNSFIRKLYLSKRSWGISSYEANIGNKLIPIDLRFIGDGYFDKLWENNMLNNKIFDQNLVPRPCNLDYFYSLLYHSKLQKRKVKKIYSKRLDNLKIILEINFLKNSFIYDDSITSKLLSDFMNFNKYIISKPLDISVEFNKGFHKKLKSLQEIIDTSQTPTIVKLILIIPSSIRNLILKTKKFLVDLYK